MQQKRHFTFSKLGLTGIGLGLLFLALNLGQSACNDNPGAKNAPVTVLNTSASPQGIQPILSGIVPSEVQLPKNDTLSPENNRPFFDQFSWQSFIALCWPVVPDKRGVPLNPNDTSTFLNMSNTTPVVWTSYKNQWDLFGQGPNTPSGWDSWTNPVNLCQGSKALGHVFGTAKSEMLPGDGDESFSVPLIDQNRNYALFEIKYNRVQYDFLLNNQLYLNTGLESYKNSHNGAVTMPSSTTNKEGSILVKAAWRVMTANDDLSRYYIIDEPVYDPVTKTCKTQKMGLVGLHIAQKVDIFPEWVWSSFEQVDNVPGAPNAKAPYSFNNGTEKPPTKGGYANKPDSAGLNKNQASRVPVQVTRLNPIPTTPALLSTADLNARYQKAVGNTWMQYYQLVITQWPTNPGSFKQSFNNGIYPQDCGQPFPVYNCANTTMETYYQSRNDAERIGGNSCMSCHYNSPGTDFAWSVQLRSHQ